jgi:hypothetical protein
MKLGVALCALAAIPLAVSCSSSDSTPAGAGGGAGGGGVGGGGGSGGSAGLKCDTTAELDMTGTWAIFFQYSIGLQKQTGGAIEMCPVDQVSSSTMFLLLDITQTGTAVQTKPINCGLTLPAVSGLVGSCDPTADNLVTVEILAPQNLIDAMPSVKMNPAAGTLAATAPGSKLTMTDAFLYLIGSSKGGADMPRWLDTNPGCSPDLSNVNVGRNGVCDPNCVSDCTPMLDADSDGKTGVTFNVCGTTKDDVASKVKCVPEDPSSAGVTIQGRVYLDFQTDPLVTGTVKSSCEASGTFAATTLYYVAGADIYMSNSPIPVASAIKSLPTYEISPTESKFRMIRVDGKHGAPDWKVNLTDASAACKIAIQHQNELQ